MDNQEVIDPLEQRWVVLDRLLQELGKKYDIPPEVTKNLQYARSLTHYYNQDPTEPDRAKELPRIDSYLHDSELKLMGMAGMEGEEFVSEWEQRLLDASQGKEVFKQAKIQSKFIPGMPANFDFVRFNFKKPIHEERFMEFRDRITGESAKEELPVWERISAAAGMALFNPDMDMNIDNVFRRADKAMYENKKSMKAER